jgi:hypothetical protein
LLVPVDHDDLPVLVVEMVPEPAVRAMMES